MKSWTKPAAYLSIALCLIGSARTDDSQHQTFRNSNRRIDKLIKMIWDADTLKNNSIYVHNCSNKSLYELLLPDSVLHDNIDNLVRPDTIKLMFPDEIESEMLGLQNRAWKEYSKYNDPKTQEYAIKAIAYLQYAAIKYPGTQGSELEIDVRLIDRISKDIRETNKRSIK